MVILLITGGLELNMSECIMAILGTIRLMQISYWLVPYEMR